MYECWSLIFMRDIVVHLSGVTVGLEQTSYTVGREWNTECVCCAEWYGPEKCDCHSFNFSRNSTK